MSNERQEGIEIGKVSAYLSMQRNPCRIKTVDVAEKLGIDPNRVVSILQELEESGEIKIQSTEMVIGINSSRKQKGSRKITKAIGDSLGKEVSNSESLDYHLKEEYKGITLSKCLEKILQEEEDDGGLQAIDFASRIYNMKDDKPASFYTARISTALSQGVKSGKFIKLEKGFYDLSNKLTNTD